MARVTFGAQRQPRQRTQIRPTRVAQQRRNWYEDPGQILGWVRLAEALAAPKGLIARGVRAAQRWQLEQDAEARKEAIEVDQQLNMLRQRASQGDAGAMHALDPMGGFDQDPAPSPEQRAQLMADYQGGMRPADPLFRTSTDPGVKPQEQPFWELPALRGAQQRPPTAPAASTAPLAVPAMPAGEPVSRADVRAMEPLLRTMRPSMRNVGGMPEAQAHLGEFFPQYMTLLGERLQREQETGEPMMIPDWFREQTPQAAEPAPAPEAPVGYRAARRAQEEAQAAKAKEVEDYAADMSLSTIEEVYNDFSKFAASHEGPLGPNDFADFYEQLKLITDRDPALVEGLALDPVGTKRQILRDAMAYFKFLNMGGDPNAVLRSHKERYWKTKADKAEKDAEKKPLTRKGYRPTRGAPEGFFDWKDDLNAWANKMRYPGDKRFANIPRYLGDVGDRPGSAINAVRKRMLRELKDSWGEKSGWTRAQNKVWKSLQKELEGHRTVITQGSVKPPSPAKESAEERRYKAALTKHKEAVAKRKAEEERFAALEGREKKNQKKSHQSALSRLLREEAGAEAVLSQATRNLEEADPAYFGQSVDEESVDLPPGFTQR